MELSRSSEVRGVYYRALSLFGLFAQKLAAYIIDWYSLSCSGGHNKLFFTHSLISRSLVRRSSVRVCVQGVSSEYSKIFKVRAEYFVSLLRSLHYIWSVLRSYELFRCFGEL